MTEKEIEDIKKDLLPILEKESGWRTEYNTIYYYGEH